MFWNWNRFSPRIHTAVELHNLPVLRLSGLAQSDVRQRRASDRNRRQDNVLLSQAFLWLSKLWKFKREKRKIRLFLEIVLHREMLYASVRQKVRATADLQPVRRGFRKIQRPSLSKSIWPRAAFGMLATFWRTRLSGDQFNTVYAQNTASRRQF